MGYHGSSGSSHAFVRSWRGSDSHHDQHHHRRRLVRQQSVLSGQASVPPRCSHSRARRVRYRYEPLLVVWGLLAGLPDGRRPLRLTTSEEHPWTHRSESTYSMSRRQPPVSPAVEVRRGLRRRSRASSATSSLAATATTSQSRTSTSMRQTFAPSTSRSSKRSRPAGYSIP